MDFWSRLLGSAITPKKPTRPAANDAATRLNRFKKVYNALLELCDRPRDLATDAATLDQVNGLIERITILLRDETRAPVPHVCFRFASSKQIYAVIARAATVSQHESIIRSTISLFASLVDSEEEDFLASGHFARCLMHLVRRVVESGDILIDTETETAILELLFTIAARIRLQPDILPVWFQSTAKPEQEHVCVKEKKSFAGITQKDDFPLCYLLIDRVHHEGRIGDFARTGLLYVFEATGRSLDLEEWVVSSDLPTLMASGLGALYSQLSRELSILHADAELPAVLAMSDYSTTHSRATAESAFSDRHKAHIMTFLSYLAFWQDVLDHCRSSDVKQTLLDHFQILFLQQLLYPSLLQSSDTDAGSSVAVLTYMTAILEALEYPDLIDMILRYLLAIQDEPASITSALPPPAPSDAPPQSPTTVKRRQSLMLLNAPKDPSDAVEPILFNLVDLIINNIGSQNSQSVFAALKLTSTLISRQKKYAFSSLLKLIHVKPNDPGRTLGALESEVAHYFQLASSLHKHYGLQLAYAQHCEDVRYIIETQTELLPGASSTKAESQEHVGKFELLDHDLCLRTMRALLRTFWTNSIDVNLALTQSFISLAQCVELRLDGWVSMHPSFYATSTGPQSSARSWQSYLDDEESAAWSNLSHALEEPIWSERHAPALYQELEALATELQTVQDRVPNLDQLIAGRKNMLQAAGLETTSSEQLPSLMSEIEQRNAVSDASRTGRGHSRTHGQPPKALDALTPHSAASSSTASRAASKSPAPSTDGDSHTLSMFRPPPPEMPSTTDILMQTIAFPTPSAGEKEGAQVREAGSKEGNQANSSDPHTTRSASLNHILTNVVVLQEFVLELVAILQIRAAVLGEKEIRSV